MEERERMKRSAKRVISVIFAIVLTIIVVALELSLRIVGSFSPTANRYIHGLLQRNTILSGFLCAFFMVAGCAVAYVKVSEQKTTGGRAVCIILLVTYLAVMLYGFLTIHQILLV